MLFVAFVFAAIQKGGHHWRSSLFAALEACYIAALLTLLAQKQVPRNAILNLLPGLFFIHGLLYLIAAKPFLIRRGYLKPGKT